MTSQKEQLSYLLKSDKDLEELIKSIPKIVPFKREKGFEGLVRLICEQQLSVASAKAIFDEDLRKELCKIRGIGKWTADCYMLASLKREDIWPVGDLGLQISVQKLKKLPNRPSEMELEEISVKWKPYRTLVANMLWNSYD